MAPEVAPPCTIGTGNWPPTRKFASLPLVVTRLGSARICRMVSFWRALIKAPRFSLGSSANKFKACVMLKVPPLPELVVWQPPLVQVVRVPEEVGGIATWPVKLLLVNCPVPDPIALPPGPASRFTPYCSSLERSSSANFTRNRICFSAGGGGRVRLFISVLAKDAARAPALSITSLLDTDPLSVTVSRELYAVMASLGKDCLRSWRSGSRFISTLTL